MKTIVILITAMMLFSIGYAAPTSLHDVPQLLHLHKAENQVLKKTKLAFVDFILDVLSTMSDNLKNHVEVLKGLRDPNLIFTMMGKLISGWKKDEDPNNVLAQMFLDLFNTILLQMSMNFDNGSTQSQISFGSKRMAN